MKFIKAFLNIILENLINPAITLLTAMLVCYFLYGLVIFMKALYEGKDEEIKKGKAHALWGFLGVFLIYTAPYIYKLFLSIFE